LRGLLHSFQYGSRPSRRNFVLADLFAPAIVNLKTHSNIDRQALTRMPFAEGANQPVRIQPNSKGQDA
jgi:hypothetical protein